MILLVGCWTLLDTFQVHHMSIPSAERPFFSRWYKHPNTHTHNNKYILPLQQGLPCPAPLGSHPAQAAPTGRSPPVLGMRGEHVQQVDGRLRRTVNEVTQGRHLGWGMGGGMDGSRAERRGGLEVASKGVLEKVKE